jgi:SNF2 family DNA or RNA helicase
MAIIPHDYQLKGAAQAHALCDSPFRGILIGHAMGVGKTMIAILAMWLRRHEPGMSLAICPASLCEQWVETIEHTWKEVCDYQFL